MPQDGLPDTPDGPAEAKLTQPPSPAAPGRRRRLSPARLLLALLGIVLLVPLVAAIAVVVLFDPASQAPRIAAAVRQATGRDLRIGSLRVAWALSPTLSAEGIELANAPGGSEPAMLRVARAELRIALLPLLSQRLEMASLRLIDPRLLLETDAEGRGNWVFAPRPASASEAPAATAGRGTRLLPDLRRVQIEGGALRLRDGRTGRVVDATLPRLDLDAAPDAATQVTADAAVAGMSVAVRGETGPLGRLFRSVAGAGPPWPLHLSIQGNDGVQATVQGTVDDPATLAGAALAVDATVPNLAPFLPSLPLRDLRVGARWASTGVRDITATAGEADLSALAPGLVLRSASFATPALDQPAQVAFEGMLAGSPVLASASVLLRPDRQGVALRSLRASGPDGDLAGDAAVSWSSRPALRGSLVSRRLDLDALRARLRLQVVPGGTPEPDAGPSPAPAASGQTRLIPDMAVPFGRLRLADADLRWSASALRLGGFDWQDAQARAVLQDGRLRLDPVAATMPGGGRWEGSLAADGSLPEPLVSLVLQSSGLQLAPLAAALGRTDGAAGTMQVSADLRSTGGTLRALAATLDGSAGVSLVDGELDAAAMFPALAALLRSAGIPATLRGRSQVRCLALRVSADHGTVLLRTAYLDSSRLRLSGEGSANLADETLALRLKPALRLGPTDAVVPLRLEGTFARPEPHLDAIVPGRVGAVIGAPRSQADECLPALAAARVGRDGPLPSATDAPQPPAASTNPADVLRRLLR